MESEIFSVLEAHMEHIERKQGDVLDLVKTLVALEERVSRIEKRVYPGLDVLGIWVAVAYYWHDVHKVVLAHLSNEDLLHLIAHTAANYEDLFFTPKAIMDHLDDTLKSIVAKTKFLPDFWKGRATERIWWLERGKRGVTLEQKAN